MLGLERKQLIMVAVLMAGAVLVVLNQTLLSPALPVIMRDLGIEATTVQWLMSGYSLTEAVIIPLSAWFIGQFSTRKLFIGGMILFAVGSLIAALAPSFPFLLLGRVCQAACTGVVMPMVFTLVLLVFPREKRGLAMGIVTLVIGFAPAVGPSLGGVLVDTMGWRILFAVVTALTVAVIVLAAMFLENRGGFEKATFDKLSVALIALGMVPLLYSLSTFASSENIFVSVALIAVGVVLLVLFVRRQLKLEVPLLKVDVLRTRRYRTAVFLVMLLEAAFIGLGVVLPLYIQNVLGHPATVSGLSMLPGAVIGAICGFFAGKLFDRYGVRGLVVGGGLVLALSGVAMALLQIDSSILLVAGAYTVLAVGAQFIMTPLNTWGVNSLDNRVIQHANALSNTLNQVGASFGTALIVSLSAFSGVLAPNASAHEQLYMGYHISFIAVAVLMLLAFVGMLVFVRNRPSDEAEKAAALAEAAQERAAKRVGTPEGMVPMETVADAMNAKPSYVLEGTPVLEALSMFANFETSGLPIVKEDMTVVGFLSDADVLNYLAKKQESFTSFNYYELLTDNEEYGERLAKLSDMDVMTLATKQVVGVSSFTPLEEACAMLSERRIKKMPVIDDGKLVGSLSRRNLVTAIANSVVQA